MFVQVLRIVERQRNALNSSDTRIEVQLSEEMTLLAEIEIRSTMKDIKLLEEETGMGLSNFPCTLCEASKSDIRDPVNITRGFPVTRTLTGLHRTGHLARINPDGLNRTQLGELLKGSKAVPLTLGEAPMIHNSYESLHFKLSMARWLKNILVRVNSKIYVWNLDQALKQICRPHEDLLENQMTMVLGLQKRLQLQVILEVFMPKVSNFFQWIPSLSPLVHWSIQKCEFYAGAFSNVHLFQGNEADRILSPHNIEDILSLVTNLEHLGKMRHLITELSYMNLVIQSLQPKEDHSLSEFAARARDLQLFLLQYYSWIVWPQYFHIAAAHTVEILQTTDSISKYSAQAKEQKNKYVRHFKLHFSRRHDNALSIQDVLSRSVSHKQPKNMNYK